MSGDERDQPARPIRQRSGQPGEGRSVAASPNPRDRLELERRRAVRAESRLAEIELVLRRALDRANGDGISASALRSLLESVHSRVASLEDEVRASERELLDIVAAQRKTLSTLAVDREELAIGLEQARQELRDVVQSEGAGLPELTRQRLEIDVELDRLQSLVADRDRVCEGLAGDLEEGARVAAEVAARLTELARGRVAAPRRGVAADARVLALRRELEKEQADLHQARRALEAARAELKVAQRGVVEVEEKVAGRLAPLEQRVREVEAERERLEAEVEAAEARALAERSRLEQSLDRERAARVQANEAVRILEKRLADLERQLTISGEEREERLRARLGESEKDAERVEAERIRLAERVSLLQAALSAKEAEVERLAKAAGGERRPGAKVLPLVQERPGEAAGGRDGAAEVLAERQSELDKLSGRWRRLQAAYQEAVAEFDEVRAKRDQLLRVLPPAGAGAVTGVAPGTPPASETPGADVAARPAADDDGASEDGAGEDSWVVAESAPRRLMIVQLDDRPELISALRRLAADKAVPFHAGPGVDAAEATDLYVAANLAAEHREALPALAEVARGRAARALLYGATAERGRVFAAADVFPAPFDPIVCATYLLGRNPQLRRIMTVGEFPDMMGRLRELLGRSRCSTAVAFDRRQALDLVTLVRPEYVLIDLALAEGTAFDLLIELAALSDPAVRIGVTWSRPIAPAWLGAAVGERLPGSPLEPRRFAEAVAAIAFDRDTPPQ